MRWIAMMGVLIVLSGSKCSDSTSDSTQEPDRGMTVRGTLTNEGVECPALRSDSGELYTLSGNIGDFRPGDQVCVKGHRAEMSICQQGVTIVIDWIGRTCPD